MQESLEKNNLCKKESSFFGSERKQPPEDFHDAFIDCIDSKYLHDKVVVHTREICNEIIDNLIKRIKLIAVPLIVVIVALLIYIFSTITTTMNSLTENTQELNTTVRLFQQSFEVINERTRDNSQAIKLLLQEKYKK